MDIKTTIIKFLDKEHPANANISEGVMNAVQQLGIAVNDEYEDGYIKSTVVKCIVEALANINLIEHERIAEGYRAKEEQEQK